MKNSGFRIGGFFRCECYDKDGNFKWEIDSLNLETKKGNLLTQSGINHALNVLVDGLTETPIDPWYVGLKGSAAGQASDDNLDSHAGWTENTNYAGDRKEYNPAAAVDREITNSANKAEFVIDTESQTIHGAFLTEASTGTAPTDEVLCIADFTSSKTASTDDSLFVTYTLGAADA